MSSILYVVTNTKGSGDRCVVYETNCGETIFDNKIISPLDLFNILSETNGMCEYVYFRDLTDEQMDEWEEHL